jgi:hypothetical protein
VKVWNAEVVHDGGPAPAEHELDEQQSLLLAALRGAPGHALSYRELQNAGVEYPASIVEELELAGLPVERANIGLTPGRGPIRGVRLAPASDRSETRRVQWYTTGVLPPLPSALRERVRELAPSRSRALVPALLLALAAAVAALVAVVATRSAAPVRPHVLSARTRAAIRSRSPAVSVATAAPPQTAPPAAPQTQAPAPPTGQPSASATPPAPAPASQTPPSAGGTPAPATALPAAASDLEARGHSLLEANHAAQAVPVLERAVAASGGNLQRCSEPAEEACLTYAYALYDLGSALRRAGRAAAAVPILELRLRIANQRPIVASELDRARREARA